jgi:hypothetical protein
MLLTQYARKPLVLPKKGIIVDSSLVLYAPLWHPHLSLSPALSKDKNQHVLTNYGSVWTLRGRSFDGTDDYVSVPTLTGRGTDVRFTIEVWINPARITGKQLILGKNEWWRPGLFLSGNKLYAHVRRSSDNVDFEVLGVTSLSVNNFYHLVATLNVNDASSLKIYLNGQLEKQGGSIGSAVYEIIDSFIGGWAPEAKWYQGLIGEVRIYNRALIVTEIQQNYLATKWRYQ